MKKAIIVAAATALAIAPFTVLTASVAHADVCDDQAAKTPGYGGSAGYLQCKAILAQQKRHTPAAPPRQTQAPPSSVQTPQFKPPPPPPPPPVVPVVQTPKISPPGPGASKNAPPVTPPKSLEAPPQGIAAAKAAPPARVNPATPPPAQVDFNRQVNNVVSAHGGNVDIVSADHQALTRPRVWDYVSYDVYHRPALYNPLDEAMSFRYFYNGAFRQLTVPAGGRAVLDVATIGVFPFTAVSDSYLASGSFYGGAWIPPDGFDGPPPPDYTPPANPEVYHNVSVDVPADNQTVQVGQVTVIGHDDSQPTGSQDTFLIDDSTLAWGQVNDPNSGAQIKVTKTQSLPGVGPTDNGSFLVALTAAHEQPTDNTWWLWPIGGGVLVIAAGLITWIVLRRKRTEELNTAPGEL